MNIKNATDRRKEAPHVHAALRLALSILALLAFVARPASAAVDLSALRPLPVLDDGRVKPIDTFAVETVRFVTGNGSFGTVVAGDGGQTVTAKMEPLAVLLDWSARPAVWEKRPLLYVPLLELRARLGMPASDKWISPRALRTSADFRAWTKDLLARHAAAERDGEEVTNTRVETAALELERRIRTFDAASSLTAIDVLPDAGNADHWFNLSELTAPAMANSSAGAIGRAWTATSAAYATDDDAAFARAATDLRSAVGSVAGDGYVDHARMDREVFYNRVTPFRLVWIAYGLAVVLLVASNMVRRPAVYRIAMAGFAAALCLHVASFILRCSITGWAPVTNMYETVIWVSMMAAIVALVLEAVYRRRTAALGGATVALLAAVVADAMPPEYGGSIRNLTPVLRSNYWLVIHVLTIVSSYAAFALAMVLGDAVLVQFIRLARRGPGDNEPLRDSIRQNLQFVYRSVQVGVLLVAAGTILGGLWADVSWGRFWGWDPKEVWALIVLLTYLTLLHGRFAGWVGPFGLAAGSVVCFTAVLMSWYGVNFVLGTGLHAYGFGAGGQGYVATFVAAELAFVGVATVIHRRGLAAKALRAAPVPPIADGRFGQGPATA